MAAFTVVAAACSSDKTSAPDTGGVATTVSPATTDSGTPNTGSTDSSTPSTGSTDSSNPATTEGTSNGPPGANHAATDTAGPPAHGGSLVIGIDSDTANAWAPYRASMAGSGYTVLQSISDSLFTVNDKGESVPLLVKTVDHNADYTQWTLHMRDGIKFQDGTPLDGEAVKFNIDSCLYSPLTASAYSSIGDVTASGQDVVINIKGTPWVALPSFFSDGQCGFMMSKQWLSSLPDVPQRNDKTPVYDAALAATPATGDPAKPVGLGAFTFESYTPGNGNSFKATRNKDYWRGPNGITGEDLPYLDSIEAVVYVDADSRFNAVRSGDINAMQTANADTIKQALDNSKLKTVSTNKFGETGYLLLNVAEGPVTDPKGVNAKSPLLQLTCRQALAAAIDTTRVSKERGASLEIPANGPFGPGSAGYLEDSGYPKFDIGQAKTYMDECLKATGTSNIEFSFNTTNDPFNVETNQLIVSMWNDAFGGKVKTSITPIEQGQYIGLALTGSFQVFGWRNHSGSDPDQQRIWWQSSASAPLGSLALNFGRFKDDVIDKALEVIKSNPDQAARTAAAETVNKQFGAEVYNLWLTRSLSGLISQPYVNGVSAHTIPGGGKGIGLHGQQRQQFNQMWCDNGKCQ
ncbi:MAG: ABC transporter substrate-binding protein [Ilumatobacteraceae bacterium]